MLFGDSNSALNLRIRAPLETNPHLFVLWLTNAVPLQARMIEPVYSVDTLTLPSLVNTMLQEKLAETAEVAVVRYWRV
jgi:hypothetical protein